MKRNRLDISIVEFCRTGRFGPVALGMSRHDVLALLGEPDVAGAGNLETRLCKYGDIEFHFQEKTGLLYLIWCDHIPFPGERSRRVRLSSWLFKGRERPGKETVEKGLSEHGIAFCCRELESETVPGLTLFPPDDDGTITFLSDESRGEFVLESGVEIRFGNIIAHYGANPPRLIEKDVVLSIGAFDPALAAAPEEGRRR